MKIYRDSYIQLVGEIAKKKPSLNVHFDPKYCVWIIFEMVARSSEITNGISVGMEIWSNCGIVAKAHRFKLVDKLEF